MNQIKQVTKQGEVRYAEVDDQTEFDKLLDKPTVKKIKPDVRSKLKEVRMRCNHATGQWIECDSSGNPSGSEFKCAILMDVKLSSVYERHGCGGHYTGMAVGLKLMAGTVIAAPDDHISKLRFDSSDGGFSDAKSGMLVNEVAFLILKAGCKHDYIQSE